MAPFGSSITARAEGRGLSAALTHGGALNGPTLHREQRQARGEWASGQALTGAPHGQQEWVLS